MRPPPSPSANHWSNREPKRATPDGNNGGWDCETTNENTIPPRAGTLPRTRSFIVSDSRLPSMPEPAAWNSIRYQPRWTASSKISSGSTRIVTSKSLLPGAIDAAENTFKPCAMSGQPNPRGLRKSREQVLQVGLNRGIAEIGADTKDFLEGSQQRSMIVVYRVAVT